VKILFVRDETMAEQAPIRFEKGSEGGTSAYLLPESVLASPAPSGEVARGLSAFLQISTAIHCSRNFDELVSGILSLLFDALPAAHGAILLFERWTSEPVCVYSRTRRSAASAEISIVRAVVDRAYQAGVSILTRHSVESGEPARCTLVVPLFGRDKLLGVIYLESHAPEAIFEQDHLQLATAVGVVAGMAMESVRYLEWLRAENDRLQAEINVGDDLIGSSSRMREVYHFIAKVAPTDSTVLLCGESGTGKELVARAIFRNSSRSAQPFVAINCAALNENLLESELFGHEKGAFTGAVVQKPGKLQVADHGTVFLDEVGELPLGTQAKLLRAIQEREFERVGGTRPVHVDIRLVAATNRDLRGAVAKGEFREDLYYRLSVVSLTMPPLRDRRADIPLLASHFATKHGERSKRPVAGISPEACTCLLAYDWPGNVRELENAIERAVVLGCTNLILPEDLPDTVLESSPAVEDAQGGYQDAIRRAKKAQILMALERARGNYTDAAKVLGLHPNYLHRLIRNLDLRDAIRKLQSESGQADG
jgi:transcriptional regulator with GAF, ATPase, and Fis domain